MIRKIGGSHMSLTNSNEREKQILQDIAIKLNNSGKRSITNKKCDGSSYYENTSYSQSEYIREYSFDSIIELKSILKQFWQGEDFMCEFIPVVLASAFKNRLEAAYNEQKSLLDQNTRGEDKEILPTFIYTM